MFVTPTTIANICYHKTSILLKYFNHLIQPKMIKLFTFFILILFSHELLAQTFTIRGYITDQSNGERLINANIYDPTRVQGTISNNFGFYSLTLPEGQYQINCSYVGYQPQSITLQLTRDTIVDFKLSPRLNLQEVTVVGHQIESKLTSTQMSKDEISVDKIQSLPAFLGEADVIKTIQLLPGVQSGAEGTSGLYVRGGGPDQNLILLDDVPIYNANHLFGFFSVFNPDAIKTVSLYKGGFPARFGGRLSSVIDIRMKDGNDQQLHGNFSVGLISSKINLEGPLVRNKTTFNLSLRRTYADLLMRPYIKSNSGGEDDGGYFFHDINMKLSHKFSDRSKLYLSTYAGRDKAFSRYDYTYGSDDTRWREKENFQLVWGNITTALRWNYLLTNKLFANTTLTYSNYLFDIQEHTTEANQNTGEEGDEYKMTYKSGIEDVGAKVDFDYYPIPDHRVKFGVNFIHHTFKPGIMAYKESYDYSSDIDTTYGNSNINANELYAYIEDNFDISRNLSLNIGLHASGFNVDGQFYTSLQPRLSARYMANDRLSFKAAYSKMNQYIHLLSSSTIDLPTDLWLPTTKKVKPQNSHQFALGAVYQLKKGLDLSVEGFYKKMDHLLEYKEGASFIGASTGWEEKVEMGTGWSYGTEFLLQKTTGKTTGWIGYTLSWANRQFENLNFGKKFNARYDRRHDISFVMTHRFSDRFDIGLTWVYGTGNAVTMPTQTINSPILPLVNYNIREYEYYGERNNFRMPSYHRLDVGFNFHKQKKHGIRTWNISLYNAYSRQNPFFLFFDSTSDKEFQQTGKTQVLKQFSLFPIIPSFSYSFKF